MLIFLLLAFATFRLTRLVVKDRLFAPIVLRVQEWFEAKYLADHPDDEAGDEWLAPGAYLLSCPWCVSVYVGGLLVLVTALVASVPLPWLVWPAVSAVTGLIAANWDED